jgi:type I restriction enzyme S subunit
MKKGWQTKKLGDVCEVIAGQSPEGKFYNAEAKGMPFYQGKKDFGDKFIEAPTTWTTQTTKIAKEGDILMSVRAPVGPVNFATDEVCIGRGLAAIRSSDELNRDFLFYQLWHLQPEIAGREGAVFASINKAEIEALPLAYAPLAEQQRIVGLLDEAFEGLATAKANAEKNLQNARALFESHLQSVFTQRGPGWVVKHLKEVCEKITDGTHQTPKYFDQGIVFLSSRNVTSGTIDWNRIKYIDTKQHLEMHKRVAPRRNDILLAKNGTTGVAAIVDRDTTFDIYVSLALLRALPVMRPRFLLHFINSPAAKVQFNKRLKGVGVPNLHLEEIREVRLAFPADLKAQDRVADELDDLREETQRLARLYEQKHAALEALKKSLLHQAFSGEL